MAKPVFTYRYYSPKLRQFVAATFKGPKRRIAIRINYEALRKAGAQASKRAKTKRNEKIKKQRQKKLSGKRSAAARKTGVRSRKGKRPNQRVYIIPFFAKRTPNGIAWGISRDAINAAYQIEKGWSKKNPPEIRGWMNVSFKDEPGDDTWILAEFSSLADEPNAGEDMADAIEYRLAEYQIANVNNVELEVTYSEEI